MPPRVLFFCKAGYELKANTSSPPWRGQGWVYPHRTPGRHRHHRHPGWLVVTGPFASQAESHGRRLHQQPAPTAHRLALVRRRQQRRLGVE